MIFVDKFAKFGQMKNENKDYKTGGYPLSPAKYYLILSNGYNWNLENNSINRWWDFDFL